MSLLQQDKNASNGNNVDPMQFQHQQLMSQFQRTVSSSLPSKTNLLQIKKLRPNYDRIALIL